MRGAGGGRKAAPLRGLACEGKISHLMKLCVAPWLKSRCRRVKASPGATCARDRQSPHWSARHGTDALCCALNHERRHFYNCCASCDPSVAQTAGHARASQRRGYWTPLLGLGSDISHHIAPHVCLCARRDAVVAFQHTRPTGPRYPRRRPLQQPGTQSAPTGIPAELVSLHHRPRLHPCRLDLEARN